MCQPCTPGYHLLIELPSQMFTYHVLLLAFCFVSCSLSQHAGVVEAQNTTVPVDVGVVLDLQTLAGKRNLASLSLAIDDFYASHANYRTRLVLHQRDSAQDVIGAASAALDLLKNTKVQAIIGPLTSSQADFVAGLGSKAQVPIISFSASDPSLSSARTPYFVRTTLNDSSQVGPISAMIKHFGWREVVPIYEDTDYGAGVIPYIIDAFQAIDTRVPYRSVIPSSAMEDMITAELYKLMSMQTRVFVVHMLPLLAARLFAKAKDIGMLEEGYVWIMTDGIGDVVDLLDHAVTDSMQGALAVRHYVQRSSEIVKFTAGWKARFRRDNPGIETMDPSVFQFWAYDTVWALAMAVEQAGTLNLSFQQPKGGAVYSTDLGTLGVSKNGPKLLEAILSTRFRGVSGEFRLVHGQLQSSVFEIVNVVGRAGRRIGLWYPDGGLSNSSLDQSSSKSTSPVNLKQVIWPGDSTSRPKGWQIPTNGRRLKIGVPVKDGFNEFVDVKRDPITNATQVTGYCIDVFDAVMSSLPYAVPYDYIPFGDADGKSAWTYNELVDQVYQQTYDAVVGDTTIIAKRAEHVDFTMPFTESGVSIIVPVEEKKSKNMWIFLEPLTTDLWLGTLTFFFFTGFIVWVIEHRINPEFRGPPSQQLGMIFYFAFSTLVFAHKEKLESNLSRVVIIIWVFVVLILTSSYTASLTSMLTVQQLQPTVTDIIELLKSGDYIGYQDGSFVIDLLKGMGFKDEKLKNYSTTDQYAEALSKGSAKGGVAAIFDEIPYLKLFLSEHCTDYQMVGQTYKTDGFGFVFPRGSPLVPDVSRAILNVTEGDTMMAIERKWFGGLKNCPSDGNSLSSSSLNFQSFGGLFLITGAVSLLALVIFFASYVYKNRDELKISSNESSLWKRLISWTEHFDKKDLSSHTFKKERQLALNNDERSRGETQAAGAVTTPNFDGSLSPISIQLSDMNIGTPEEREFSTEMGDVSEERQAGDASVEINEIRNNG